MRRKIAVLLQEVSVDYTQEALQGIYSYFKDKDVDILLCQTRVPNTERGFFEKNYWASIKIIESESIDTIIVITATYCSTISPALLTDFLSPLSNKKIISIGVPLNFPRSTTVTVSCKNSYAEVIKHLKEEHGCKRIAFISANLEKSVEARERFEAFQEGLKVNNLEFNNDLLFFGEFTYGTSYDSLKRKIHCKEEINFDAILAANDMMAFGAIGFLHEMNVLVPEEVRVIGYDDIMQASSSDLTLTTISQEIFALGQKAGELADAASRGEKIPAITDIPSRVIYRKTCGCKDLNHDMETQVKFAQKGIFLKDSEDKLLVSYLQNIHSMDRIYYLLDRIQAEETLEKLFKSFGSILPQEEISGIAVCLYETPITVNDIENFKLPEKVKLTLLQDNEEQIYLNNINKEIKPSEVIVPDTYTKLSGQYILSPIFYADTHYGYFIIRFKAPMFNLLSIYIKILSNAISQAYQYTLKVQENVTLSKTSYTDVLTGIYNRRGIIDFGQDAIDYSLSIGAKGCVLFTDMDGLKHINDTYGHKYGDIAIQTQAQILQSCLRSNDIIGRLSGDEFAIVLPGMSIEYLPTLRDKISNSCITLCKEKNLPFVIDMSLGMVEFSSENRNLEQLLSLADKEQYIEKRKHHERNKNYRFDL